MSQFDGSTVLVTGGAGFIGTHLVAALAEAGARVRVLDNFDPQSHEDPDRPRPDLEAELIRGDVRNPEDVAQALDGVTHVVHLAAMVGVGQSMYEVRRYCDTNIMGTATLLEAVAERRTEIRKLLVASSMSIYGEGAYRCPACDAAREAQRSIADLEAGRFDPACLECGSSLVALPTPESKPLASTSVYALNKKDQEELCLVMGRAYGVPTVALRFFNVYGPGQSLQNPYTGVAAVFASRLVGEAPPLVFEDGAQSRDFIHVRDLAKGCLAALAGNEAADTVLNLGTGRSSSILEIAERLRALLGGPEPEILGSFRAGDIRHCFADTSRARACLAWSAEIDLEAGLEELAAWQQTQDATPERVDRAVEELRSRGLVG